MTSRGGLEAPHRRKEQGPRILEKAAVAGYATATWVVAHVPGALARWVIGTGSQAGYLALPTKRQWSNATFGHVLGLSPDDPRVRRMALRAYREYATYLVETMRLESQSGEAAAERVEEVDLDHIEREAARLRKRFQSVKEEIRAHARRAGLLPEQAEHSGAMSPPSEGP